MCARAVTSRATRGPLRRSRAGRTKVVVDEGTDELPARIRSGEHARGGAGRAAGFVPNRRLDHARAAGIRALIARGLVVTLAPELLAEAFKDLVLRPIAGSAPTRDVPALLPPGGRHPLVAPALDAVEATAAKLQAAGGR